MIFRMWAQLPGDDTPPELRARNLAEPCLAPKNDADQLTMAPQVRSSTAPVVAPAPSEAR
jgi:hypothetical protein